MKELRVDDIIKGRVEMEEIILKAIQKFEDKYGLRVEDIKLFHEMILGGFSKKTERVESVVLF